MSAWDGNAQLKEPYLIVWPGANFQEQLNWVTQENQPVKPGCHIPPSEELHLKGVPADDFRRNLGKKNFDLNLIN